MAIAARIAFGMKVEAGIILPLLLMVVTTGRGAGGAESKANDEAVGVGESTTIADSAIWA